MHIGNSSTIQNNSIFLEKFLLTVFIPSLTLLICIIFLKIIIFINQFFKFHIYLYLMNVVH